MATMIRKTESVGKHLFKVNRHVRFCYQVNGAKKFAKAIEPVYTGLEKKNKLYREAMYGRVHRHDVMTMRNGQLDDGVRTVHEKCKQHDREYPINAVLQKIFPNETFGDFINNNIFDESLIVQQLIVRLEKLGKDHPLYSLAEYLRKLIREMKKSIQIYHDAVQAEKISKIELELAKEELRKQYEVNSLDAQKDLGKKAASQLFPSKPQKKLEELPEGPDGNEDTTQAA